MGLSSLLLLPLSYRFNILPADVDVKGEQEEEEEEEVDL